MATETREMTAEEATEFRHFSVHNAVEAQEACPEATCQAYVDIFTRRRWVAQGYQVRKGEQGTEVTTWIPAPMTPRGRQRRRPKRAVLFCRHQVGRTA